MTHITLVDPASSDVKGDRTVLVVGERIAAIGGADDVTLPPGCTVIEGTGKYLLPGLWDMHVHLGNATEAALPMLLAAGITGVRDMGSPDLDALRRWHAEALAGTRLGPRIVAAGRMIDGGPPEANRLTVRTPEEARAAVATLAAEGVDFVKVHEHMTREIYFAIADEVRKRGLTFSGHVPVGEAGFLVNADEAAAAGQRVFEHMFGLPFGRIRPEMIAALKRQGAWVDPTLIVYWNRAHVAELRAREDPRLPAVAPALKEFWATQLAGFGPDPRGPEFILQARRTGLKDLAQAGIPILAGTDLGFYRVLPGDLHRELELLVEAGLTPREALRAATLEPARCLGREADLGSIAVGKLADLILIDADPLADIRNTARVSAVIFNGRVMEVGSLRERLGFTESSAALREK